MAVVATLPDDLREAMAFADVLATYEHLPPLDREKFSAWISNASDEGSRWRRIQIFVLSMRMGPLRPDDGDDASFGSPAQVG